MNQKSYILQGLRFVCKSNCMYFWKQIPSKSLIGYNEKNYEKKTIWRPTDRAFQNFKPFINSFYCINQGLSKHQEVSSTPVSKVKNRFWFCGTFLVHQKGKSWNIGSLRFIQTIGAKYGSSNEGEINYSKLVFQFFKSKFIEILNVALFQWLNNHKKKKRNYKLHILPQVSCQSEIHLREGFNKKKV